jgi:hypothetical protein
LQSLAVAKRAEKRLMKEEEDEEEEEEERQPVAAALLKSTAVSRAAKPKRTGIGFDLDL